MWETLQLMLCYARVAKAARLQLCILAKIVRHARGAALHAHAQHDRLYKQAASKLRYSSTSKPARDPPPFQAGKLTPRCEAGKPPHLLQAGNIIHPYATIPYPTLI